MTSTVWVVLANDNVEAVCATQALAEIFMDDKRRAEKARQYPPGPHRRTYWNAHPFQVMEKIA